METSTLMSLFPNSLELGAAAAPTAKTESMAAMENCMVLIQT
jgi:hypothetical protein